MISPLTDEHYRILEAARDGRLRCNAAGRWIIDGENVRPERKARETCLNRMLISPWPNPVRITTKGLRELANR